MKRRSVVRTGRVVVITGKVIVLTRSESAAWKKVLAKDADADVALVNRLRAQAWEVAKVIGSACEIRSDAGDLLETIGGAL